ncbi:MAG: response regulator [Candidatus Cloacimonetes bacterium]|nr:response regulator [Candidatus Cloacimonadota bacterium]MDD2506637.1 response regulator [Candidatus Cloacimonadota bacterium]MDD4560372.1 response regulator [Candidatus Cloacimonadota bacterium]
MESHIRKIIDKAIFGYAYHEILLDKSGKPCDYRFIETNEAFGELTGLDHKKIIGKTLKEVLPKSSEDDFDWIGFYGNVAEQGGSHMVDAESKPLGKSFRIQAISFEKGYFATLFFDVSLYKKIEMELGANEERMRLLVNNSNNWVVVLDKDLQIKYSTALGSKILGIDEKEIYNLFVYSVVHPDDVAKVQDTIQWVFEHPAELATLELRVYNSKHEVIWLEVFAFNMLQSSAIEGLIVHARDISIRKAAEEALVQSENKFRYLTDNLTDMIFMTDKELNTIYVSPSVEAMLGESPEEHLSRSMEDKHPPESLAVMQEALAEEMQKDTEPNANLNRSRMIEIQEYKKDGSLIDIAMHVTMIRDKDGNFNGLHGVTRDITFQKHTERELKEKNAYIESLLDSIPDPIFVLDKTGRLIDRKTGSADNSFLTKAEAPNQNLWDIFPKVLADNILDAIQIALDRNETIPFSFRLEMNGEHRYFEARISPMENERVISSVRDVTDHSKAVMAIQQQTRFQKMIADISTAFVNSKSLELDTILDESLKMVGEFFGVQRAYIYRYFDDYSSMFNTNEWHSRGRGRIQDKRPVYHSASIPWWSKQITSGQIIKIENLEELLPHAKTEYRVLKSQNIKSILCIPIQSGSKVMGYFGFDSLIEPRVYSESEVDNLLVVANLLAEVLLKHDREKQMRKQAKLQEIFIPMAMKYVNLNSEDLENAIRQSLAELATFSNADLAFIYDYDWDSMVCINGNEWTAQGIDTEAQLRRIIPMDLLGPWVEMHRRGETVIIDDALTADVPKQLREFMVTQRVKSMITLPIMNMGMCQGFVGFNYIRKTHRFTKTDSMLLSLFAQLLVNVRNRRDLERRLIQEKVRAENASKAKSEFLANMSHEIRTPLNGVIGFTELLQNSALDNAQQQYAQNIINSSYNLLGIINDILDFSKIEAGKLDLSPTRTDLIELVEQAADIIKLRTSKKDLEFLLDISPDIPRFAIIDPLRLNQILINLLSNAEKFTEEGEIELSVRYEMTDADHTDITFTVRDTGIGINESMQKKLFRAFSQLDSSTTRKYGGTGLGLVISNHLATLMNSHINISSIPDQGSEFSFTINCRVEGKRYCDHELELTKTVMVVDDNASCRRIIKQCLTYWKIDVLECGSAQEALEMLQNVSAPDVIFVDYDMPEMNGLDLIRRVQNETLKISQTTPVVLMHSSDENPALISACQELGINYRFLKPVKAYDLHKALENIESGGQDLTQENIERKDRLPMSETDLIEKPSILIAEDNQLNMILLNEMILKLSPKAQIWHATDGLQAIDGVRKHSPDVVLMDVQMPNLDGVSASFEIRKFSSVPIIAITAGALKEEQERCLAAGINDFLTKPVLVAELAATLSKYLSNESQEKSASYQTKTATDNASHFAKDALLKNISGDLDTFKSLLEIVATSFPDKFEALNQAITEEDSKEALSILHSLKGSARNMHFVLLGDMVADLERDYPNLEAAEVRARYQNIIQEWQFVQDLIK